MKQLEREAKIKELKSRPRGRYRKPDDHAPIRLYHSDFRDLKRIARIQPGTVDLVLTEVPYDRKFTTQFDDLGSFAARVLRDGGVFCVYFDVCWAEPEFGISANRASERTRRLSAFDVKAKRDAGSFESPLHRMVYIFGKEGM